MRIIEAAAVHAALPYDKLTAHLREAFCIGGEVPLRSHYHIDTPGSAAGGTLLIMPAWQPGRHIGIKAVSVFPDNARVGLPSVIGAYLLLDANTGAPKAVIDGVALTLRRTACASALAARYLARKDAQHLLMVGAGSLAPHLVRAHHAAQRYKRIEIWNRSRARAEALAAKLSDLDAAVVVADDLESAVRAADVISCATLSREPLVRGDWLRPGTHVDLVGGFTPEMREADDAAVRKASIFVDSREGALKEAGDLVVPLKSGLLKPEDVRADLFELCRADRHARQSENEITLFKSVGLALEDLAAAELVAESVIS
ncbi:ornithine cyclodeaminase family protein [uncultured Ferrovibrio sp.]|jgi:Predicted ornithine cyclodeaminase, mu-crystallin homolog|uniref:ornithine cyclodeaminase family protein n=1 Tax=uncultured Ferrovibrio sp. TaxID=1576913 RepID=UPI00260AF40D|nr:ornithine cyclodeaminase family protein [uncultured Ferrovibrio sp.]